MAELNMLSMLTKLELTQKNLCSSDSFFNLDLRSVDYCRTLQPRTDNIQASFS
jgi:hypothetical protein